MIDPALAQLPADLLPEIHEDGAMTYRMTYNVCSMCPCGQWSICVELMSGNGRGRGFRLRGTAKMSVVVEVITPGDPRYDEGFAALQKEDRAAEFRPHFREATDAERKAFKARMAHISPHSASWRGERGGAST